MSQLDQDTIKYLTGLCRIDCTREEEAALLVDLQRIIDYMNQMQSVDTEGVEPCNHVLAEVVNVMREDAVGSTLPRDVFLANAPSHSGGLIRVPPVIKQT